MQSLRGRSIIALAAATTLAACGASAPEVRVAQASGTTVATNAVSESSPVAVTTVESATAPTDPGPLPTDPPATDPPLTEPAPTEPPLTTSIPVGAVTTMIDAGAEPRQLLRYTFVPGQVTIVDMTMAQKMAMGVGGRDQSVDQTVTAAIETTVVEPGVIELRYLTFSTASVVKLDTSFLEGVVITMRLDDRGQVSEIDSNIEQLAADSADPMVAQLAPMLGGLQTSLKDFSIALPTDPVGVGAKWTVTTTASAGGIPMSTETLNEITAINGSLVTIRQTATLRQAPGDVAIPGVPPGTEIAIEMTGTVESDVVVDLDRPGSNVSKSTSVTDATIDAEGISMDQHIEITTSTARRD